MKRSTSVGRFHLSDAPPLAILDDLQMQMIPGGTPGAAHIADDLPGLHLCAHIGLEQKINAHSHAEGKHRTDKLAGVESEKDGFAVFPNLFGDFDFDKTSPLSGK